MTNKERSWVIVESHREPFLSFGANLNASTLCQLFPEIVLHFAIFGIILTFDATDTQYTYTFDALRHGCVGQFQSILSTAKLLWIVNSVQKLTRMRFVKIRMRYYNQNRIIITIVHCSVDVCWWSWVMNQKKDNGQWLYCNRVVDVPAKCNHSQYRCLSVDRFRLSFTLANAHTKCGSQTNY